jgi:ABC-type nitrate/sulfonate/bicarbonate transport system substrate-binding protein
MSTRARIGAALTVATLLAAGCGGDDGAPAEPSEEALTRVSVADTVGAPLYFLSYGEQQGHFADAGLELEVTSSAGGATVIPQVVGGTLDVAGSNVVSVLVGVAEGLPLRMVAGGTSTSEDAEQDFSGLVVAADSPVTGIADLAGQRVAVNGLGNINAIVLGSMLEEAGLPFDDVQFVEVPFADMAAAVQGGDVAAAVLIEPFLTIAEHQGLRLVGRPYSDLRPGLQIGTYVMTEEFVAGNPSVVAAFQEGVQATAEAIRADPDAFRAALPSLGDVSPELADQVRITTWRGTSDRESLELVQDLMVRYRLLAQPVDLDEVILG